MSATATKKKNVPTLDILEVYKSEKTISTRDQERKSKLAAFLKDGTQPKLVFDGHAYFDGSHDDYVNLDGLLFTDYDWNEFTIDSLRDDGYAPHGVIVPTRKRLPQNEGFKNIVLINGDEDRNDLVNEVSEKFGMPTISFECLNRFFTGSLQNLGKLLAEGTIAVLDWNPDTYKKLTAAEVKTNEANYQLRRNNRPKEQTKLIPPEVGFTLVGDNWHRAATVLFRDKREGGVSILIGQDEGTYFGVELADHPKTIAAAFTSLMPTEIRKHKTLQRQGEWFLVPVEQKDVPAIEKCIIAAERASDEGVYLPIDSEDSNKHYIYGEVRVASDGSVYAEDGKLTHSGSEHEQIEWTGWVKFYKNTAVRSFSVAGVD